MIRVTASIVASLVVLSFAPTAGAEDTAKAPACGPPEKPQLSVLEQCIAVAADDVSLLAQCEALARAGMLREPSHGTVMGGHCKDAPPKTQPEGTSPLDQCYAAAGDDDEKLSACDRLNNTRLLRRRLGAS